MLHPLSRETIFETKKRVRRFRVLLLLVILGFYIIFFNLVSLPILFFLWIYAAKRGALFSPFDYFWEVTTGLCALSMVVAFFHYWFAGRVSLGDLLGRLRIRPADSKDSYHRRFINIVEEAEVATGIRPIWPVVVSTTGYNAFAIQDREGRSAMGITEGLLARLNRPEVSAVVAYEAAQLGSDQARLTTTACSLVEVFFKIQKGFGEMAEDSVENRHGSGEGHLLFIPWILAAFANVILNSVYICLSRKQVNLADVQAVEMCRDPLSLAEALHKIGGKYRGAIEFQKRFAPLFILNPRPSVLDEEDGLRASLFSSHPPLRERLKNLMNWANQDIRLLMEKKKEEVQETAASGPRKYFVHHEDSWKGPYSEEELKSLGFVHPMDWIAAEGEILRAIRSPGFLPVFRPDGSPSPSLHQCPRCEVALVEGTYEGAPIHHCRHCQGHLAGPGVLERIIARDEKLFTPVEKEKAREKRGRKRVGLQHACSHPPLNCPACGKQTQKAFHSSLTRVVIDKCNVCGSIWFDGGELERIQILVEDARESD